MQVHIRRYGRPMSAAFPRRSLGFHDSLAIDVAIMHLRQPHHILYTAVSREAAEPDFTQARHRGHRSIPDLNNQVDS